MSDFVNYNKKNNKKSVLSESEILQQTIQSFDHEFTLDNSEFGFLNDEMQTNAFMAKNSERFFSNDKQKSNNENNINYSDNPNNYYSNASAPAENNFSSSSQGNFYYEEFSPFETYDQQINPSRNNPADNNSPRRYAVAYNNVAPSHKKAPKQKMKTSAKAFWVVFSVLLSVLTIGYITYIVSNIINYNSSNYISGIFDTTKPPYFTEPKDEQDDENENIKNENTANINDNIINKNFKGITLASVPKDSNEKNYTIQNAFKTMGPSVVGISVYESEEDIEDIENPNQDNVTSQGTGVIVTKDGYILTNSHVILNSKICYPFVVFSSGEYYQAEIVGYDGRTDLAILKIDKADLTPAVFGDSEEADIGDDVIAIGNPGGLAYQNSLTKGIISAKERIVSSRSSTVKYIQTDAAINPGNSGGPLCNIYGQVIGINTIKVVASEFEGMGFAIPSATVKQIADDLIKNGYVENRVMLGITGMDITNAMKAQYGVPNGVAIATITKNGPMDISNIKVGDIITYLDDFEITSIQDIFTFLSDHKEGDIITVTIFRQDDSNPNGVEKEVEVTLQADVGQSQNN